MREKYQILDDIVRVRKKFNDAHSLMNEYKRRTDFYEQERDKYAREIEDLMQKLFAAIQNENSAAGTTEYDPLTGE